MNLKQNSPDLPALSTEPMPPGLAGLHAFHVLELVQLGDAINDILLAKNEETRRAQANATLVPQLREANQNLILATFGAQDSQATAEGANQRKTEFLSMLAHELRSPLHPIMIASNMIGNIATPRADIPKLNAIIQRQMVHLVRLVDDLLDASRVSTGKILIQASRVSLREIIERAVETSQPDIDSRKQQLQLDFPAEEVFLEGDLIRLTQVFSNLLFNASKYTPERGHLVIRIQADAHEVMIAVIDDGAGVPLDIQAFIFDLFTQGPRPLGHAASGLGIGLSLVRTITELHGGTVRVHSAGSGSEFTVTLPRAAAPHLPN